MSKSLLTVFSFFFAITFLQAQSGSVKVVLFSQGYTYPLGVENCGDSRLFIVQKAGQIMVCDSNGSRSTTPFLDISDRVDATGDETGLLGLAFSPQYARNGLFYVYYTNKSGNSNISQFKVSSNKNVATATSEKVVLQVTQTYRNHIGGCIKFGKDGFLYIGLGDGDGSAPGDPLNYAQNPGLLQGKMLRIKVATNGTYTIPPTNPFKDSANYRKEIWAVGLRNPWRFSFDAVNGNLWIGDVGEGTWEEVDVQKKASKGGENYGWHCYEGDAAYNTTGCKPSAYYTYPNYEYTHAGSPVADCAITGGYVYRGKKYADLYGKYFFTDFCSGIIRSLTPNGNTLVEKDEVSTGGYYSLTSFGEDSKKELYVVGSAGGQILKLISATTVSGVKSNEEAASSSLNIYPNPSHGQFSIVFTTAKAETVILNAYNSNGRNIYTAHKQSNAGENIWNMTLPDNEKGNCYITLTTASGELMRRNIVVK